ncbi:uncharacterized protein METZ01_LOCUS372556, partial [marine metagenome]
VVHRYVVAVSCVFALAVLVLPPAVAQPDNWTVPRTPWGDPDLIGTYTNKTITPVQRPDDLADR